MILNRAERIAAIGNRIKESNQLEIKRLNERIAGLREDIEAVLPSISEIMKVIRACKKYDYEISSTFTSESFRMPIENGYIGLSGFPSGITTSIECKTQSAVLWLDSQYFSVLQENSDIPLLERMRNEIATMEVFLQNFSAFEQEFYSKIDAEIEKLENNNQDYPDME